MYYLQCTSYLFLTSIIYYLVKSESRFRIAFWAEIEFKIEIEIEIVIDFVSILPVFKILSITFIQLLLLLLEILLLYYCCILTSSCIIYLLPPVVFIPELLLSNKLFCLRHIIIIFYMN